MSSISNTKTGLGLSIGIIFYVTQDVGNFSHIRIKIVHTANDTAITSAVWNIAYASTKQNDIVKIRINLPKLCHQNYCCVTPNHIENNQNVIYVNNPDKKQDGYIYISVYENHFYFVANAQLFDSSESTEISLM